MSHETCVGMWCSLQWYHNGRDRVSNHQPYDCLLNRLLRRRSKKTAKPCVTGDRWIPRTNGQLREKSFHLMTSSCNIKNIGFVQCKDHFSMYRHSNYKDKTVIRPSYLYHQDLCTGKTSSLWWAKSFSFIVSNLAPSYKLQNLFDHVCLLWCHQMDIECNAPLSDDIFHIYIYIQIHYYYVSFNGDLQVWV